MNPDDSPEAQSFSPHDLMSGHDLKPGQCIFCRRILRRGTTEHHLIPRACHRNKWFLKRYSRQQMSETVPACRDCHAAIHQFVPSEKMLGREFNTVERLMSHQGFARFVRWISRQR